MDEKNNSRGLDELILKLEMSSDANEIYDLISKIGKFKNNIKAAKALVKCLEMKDYRVYPHVWIKSNLIEIGNKEIVPDLVVLVKNAKIDYNNPRAISSTISNAVKVIGELGNSSNISCLVDLKGKILSSNIKSQYQSTGTIAGVVSINDSIELIDRAIKQLTSKKS